ncbi:DUF3850 domain-containing protein [Patescibacteria group bacterium]|nr:DUF3850 domain-containing protein [Patescibacteria group bacterium]
MAVIHKKCWPKWFDKFCSGERTFELRLADFDLKDDDVLIFEEYDPKEKKYTGRKASFKCKRVEHSAQNPLQFYKIEDVKKHGFWIIRLEKKE